MRVMVGWQSGNAAAIISDTHEQRKEFYDVLKRRARLDYKWELRCAKGPPPWQTHQNFRHANLELDAILVAQRMAGTYRTDWTEFLRVIKPDENTYGISAQVSADSHD